jgi:tetratricopeptide (TPR) repeat protein
MNLLFGQLLLNTGHYEKAASYFQLMLKVLPKHHSDLASVYDSIGNLNLRTTNWNEALKNFNNAYKIKMKSCSDKHAPDLGVTLYNLANYYKAIGDNTLALDFYRRSLKCVKNPINIALTKLNIGTILKINGQYLQALELCHESFSRLQQHDSCLYAEIITCQGLIGDIYYAQDEYNESEAFYSTAFELAKKHLFIGDLCLIHCINALADTYEKQDNGSRHRSIEFCNQQLALHEKNLPENHVSIAYILMKLGQLSDNIDFYQKALIIFEKNLHQEYASTAKCSISVAEYHHKRKMYEEALSFYTKAYQIQKKIYPANHSLIIQTEKVLSQVERKFKEESIAKRNAMTNTSL